MKGYALLLCVFLLIASETKAQKVNYSSVDDYVANMNVDTTMKMDNLVKLITRPFNDEHRKARAIFDWICLNIHYDHAGFEASLENPEAYPFKMPDEVLKRRIAICSEISSLAKEMFGRAGLKCEDIYGETRTYFSSGPFDHAWNAVYLSGKWFLFDCTWGGVNNYNKINYFYFLTPPEYLIASHLPNDIKWTLLEKNPTRDEVDRFPPVWPDYFSYSEKPFPRDKEIVSTDGSLRVTNYVIKGFVQDIRIVDKDEHYIRFRQTPVLNTAGDTTAYQISGLQNGSYTMRISGFALDPTPGTLSEGKRMVDFNLFVK
ncbi:transglutaminase domain-containing protein [Chitinophaga ginsengisoli]|uniref:Transglutaminase superfamily protein n=1 Tax=Chitinophaga ginsengisoli TaxID=363837 RepID=A0A2P8GDG4_9BACT|nr:transglutaminase domain-containing protein [Chitinophaga ginsengisoli]PSL32017.1 transglutaminase superfamily protein [Chitinophaga ginsengisoli]